MANRNLLHKSKLTAFEVWLVTNGWKLEDPKGKWEVVRARKEGRKVPLIIYDQSSGEHYSVQASDVSIVRAFISETEMKGLEAPQVVIDEQAVIDEPKLRFDWKDEDYGYHKCILYEGDEEINDIHFNDYTTEFHQKFDKEDRFIRPYAFEVGWCHGWSMHQGFDYDENCDKHRDENGHHIGGYQGVCTHTVDDIKKWCENWLAQQYLSRYYKTLENLEQMKQRAMWFESQGFVYEEGE